MLRALRRLLRPGGRIAYTTIHVAPGLTPAERRRAHWSTQGAVVSRRDHAGLLQSAGFVDVDQVDVTDAFVATMRAWLHERECHAGELERVEGAESLAERLRNGRRQLAATEDGLLRRSIFAATRPSPRR